MATCQLYRNDGKVVKVTAPNQNSSELYAAILTQIKKDGVKKYIENIPYLRKRLADGGILNETPEEIAVGLWSIVYSPEYQTFFTGMNKVLGVFADGNGEPKFSIFKSTFLDNIDTRFIDVSIPFVLTAEKKKFLKGAAKHANDLQRKVLEVLVEKPDNPVVLEPESHVYVDQDGMVYDSITKGIKGELGKDAYIINREYGTSIDNVLQGIILGKTFDEIAKSITNIDRQVLKNAFNILTVYVNGLTQDGSIVVTQVMLGDKISKRAGSMDLVVISPTGRIKIIDLKTSKNSVKTGNYDKPYQINNPGAVFMGEMLSSRQQHSIQLGAYKKLIELLGFDVDAISTVHINIKLDSENKITDMDWEGEMHHPITINMDKVSRLIPTDIESRNRIKELHQELGTDNPAEDPDFLSDEEQKPERELYGDDMFMRMFADVKQIISKFDLKKKYLEKIKSGKTRFDKEEMIDKINLLTVTMGEELRSDRPSIAYGSFLRYAIAELKSYLAEITDVDQQKQKNYVSLLLEVDTYVESYRGMISAKNMGNKEQQMMLLELIDLLDDTKEAIDYNLTEYVKNVVKSTSSKNLTQEELNSIMKETYDINTEDYFLGDMATSKDTLLALADKIYKRAINKKRDITEATISRIYELGNKLLKAAGKTKSDSRFYDFMKIFSKTGEFSGRYVGRIGTQYWETYYKLRESTREKNGESKQYIPIPDITTANQEDLDFNITLHQAKMTQREFLNAEILGPNGAEDAKYHKYTDFFKTIRGRYEQLVSYEKETGDIFYTWKKKPDVTDVQYQQYLLKYYNQVEYWGADYDSDGIYRGRVSKKSGYFVKNEYKEIRDITSDGIDLRDEKYIKLMNPTTQLEKAQSDFYKAWIEEYEKQLNKLPPEVAASMRNKVGRVSASMIDKMKANGGGFVNAAAKSMRNLITPDVYTNQRLVNELGQIDDSLPILYVGKLQNTGRVDYLKKQIDELKSKRANGKISKKEYITEKEKLKRYLKIEESKLRGSEIEGDLVNNLAVFATMAENFDVMSGIENELQAIAKIVEGRSYIQEDSLGNKLIARGSKTTKTDEGTFVYKKPDEVLVTKRLKKWFQMVFYNNQEFDRSTIAMVAKRLQNFTSLKGIGFNVFGAINNYTMARINTAIESAGGLYYERPAANRAVKEYNIDYLPNIFKGLGSSIEGYSMSKKPNSKYEAMVEYFRMIKKFQDDSGKVDIMNWAYLLQEGGEYNAQSKSGIAILMSKTLTNKKTGDTVSIYDAYEFDSNTNNLKIKDGYEMSDIERYDVTNYIHEVNKQIHGNYAFEDRMVIQESWLGQLAAQFHKWVYPSYKVRFKKRYQDENLGDVEGRYVTILNFVAYIRQAEGSFLEKLRTGWKDMDAIQVKNMYKNIAELTFFASSFAMYAVFRALAAGVDDDDKQLKRFLNFLSYQQSRQMNEITTLIPLVGVEEQYMLAKSPLAVLTTLKDFGQAIKETLALPFPPYDDILYEKGVHKGESKVWKEWKDVIPALTLLNRWDSYETVKSFYIK